MKAVLSTKLSVVRIAVFAEMAWMERRPELGLLCRAARNDGGRISAATVQSALPGVADAGARNVIAWCRTLGLCDKQGGLTALGEDVADQNEAPVPEQGVYDLWLAQHPLLGSRVLSVERLSSDPYDQRFEDIAPVQIEPDRGKVFRSVVRADERFIVRDLPNKHGQPGARPRETRASCRLRWTLDFDAERDQWQLDGMMEVWSSHGKDTLVSIQHEPESVGLDLWRLAEFWATGPLSSLGYWNSNERRLGVPFQGLTDEEVDSFRKSLKFRQVEVPGKGTYDNVELQDTPVGPRSDAEAQRWAMARLDRRLDKDPRYRSRSAVRELFAELTEDTPLEAFAPELPAHDALIGARASTQFESRASFWSLAAPVDLSPYPVTREELGPLRIGSSPPVIELDQPGQFRVPYRGGWSMRELVDQLLASTTPTRILLCDRYVRGDDNLATLRLFVDALRSVAREVKVDIWTGDEADFEPIRAITGTRPNSYPKVFGRNAPHDRYLLVAPHAGAGFGWHMSNSPLHARADVAGPGPQTPLRWKDLLAMRAPADQLEPALRSWLDGGRR
jgi:hypothetical protein